MRLPHDDDDDDESCVCHDTVLPYPIARSVIEEKRGKKKKKKSAEAI